MADYSFLLGEDDFKEKMNTEGKAWIETHVKEGDITGFDGTRLHYYTAMPDNPKAVIVIVHGFCEFFGKYHEMAWYFYQTGFGVFFMEQRGYGLSEGKTGEPDIVHIDSYNAYVEDLHAFITKVVNPESEGLKKILFAHSMGGAIGSCYLIRHPEEFKAAILSSPMMKMKADKYPKIVNDLVCLYAKLPGKSKSLGPGQRRFTGDMNFENCSALSFARHSYLFDIRLSNKAYQTNAATLGWVVASLKVRRYILKNAYRVKIPVSLMTAGRDHLVSYEGYEEWKARVPQTVIHDFPESKHEIFNADDDTRKAYYKELFAALEEYAEA